MKLLRKKRVVMSDSGISVGDKYRSNVNKWAVKEYYGYFEGVIKDTNLMREITITGLNPGDPDGREVMGVLDTGQNFACPTNVFIAVWDKVR